MKYCKVKRTAKSKCKYCKTGKESLELDHLSATCPYLDCYVDGECGMYKPLENIEQGILKRVFKKLICNLKNK